MPKVRFNADWDWKPSASTTIAYRAGDEKPVTTACAENAVALGKGEVVADSPGQSIGETIASGTRPRKKRNG